MAPGLMRHVDTRPIIHERVLDLLSSIRSDYEAVLIAAPENDSHVLAVARLLRKRGISVRVVDLARDEVSATLSCSVNGAGQCHVNSMACGYFRSAWMWRPLPAPWADKLNYGSMVDIENRLHRDLLIDSFERSSGLVVNPVQQAVRMQSKAAGLILAKQAGFFVPATVFGADPLVVRELYERCGGDIIYKPHKQHILQDGRRVTATRMSKEVVQNQDLISAMPGVYQQRVDIELELRVLVMGRRTVSVSLKNNSRFVDVKEMLGSQNTVSIHSLDASISMACVNLIRAAGLVSASLDIAILKGGEYCFLDLNPFGRFAWMEEYCPSLQVSEIFADFLMSADVDF